MSTETQAPDPVDGDVRELRKWLNEQPNRPVDRDALARLLHAFENAQPVGEIVTDCDGETVLGDEVSWRVGMPPAGTKLYAAPCAAVGEAPDHLELFKEASEWAETAKRKITPDMVELLGWLTGAANAWAEKVEDRAKAAIPAPEGAQLPPLPHPLLIAGGGQSWFNAEQMRAYARAALAAPAPQDSLDSAQSSKGVAMQAPQAPAWQPIETAPKERGGLVDIICNERRYTGCHYDRICDEYRHITACGVLIRLKGATHWMPIPAAPQTKEPTNDR